MKNIAVLAVLVIILSAYSYAEENKRNYCFSFGPQFGFVYGQTMEYVYPLPGWTKNELLSELAWDMKPVFYYGIQAEFNRIDIMSNPGFFASLSFKAGIPADSGVMEDRDWESIENKELTKFSSHTNGTDEFFWLDAAAGVSFPVKSFFYIKPFISGSWMRFSFIARDGYGIYAREKSNGIFYSINDKPNEYDFSGTEGISYQQDWLLIATGFSIGTNILYPFSFDFSFQITPLTYCVATDNHFVREIIFRDFTSLGLFIEPSFNISFTVKQVKLSLDFAYRRIGKTEGKSYIDVSDTGSYLGENKAGAGLSLLDSRFFVSIRF
jgi:outer membrane protease